MLEAKIWYFAIIRGKFRGVAEGWGFSLFMDQWTNTGKCRPKAMGFEWFLVWRVLILTILVWDRVCFYILPWYWVFGIDTLSSFSDLIIYINFHVWNAIKFMTITTKLFTMLCLYKFLVVRRRSRIVFSSAWFIKFTQVSSRNFKTTILLFSYFAMLCAKHCDSPHSHAFSFLFYFWRTLRVIEVLID